LLFFPLSAVDVERKRRLSSERGAIGIEAKDWQGMDAFKVGKKSRPTLQTPKRPAIRMVFFSRRLQ
jgi:hypothetical protein